MPALIIGGEERLAISQLQLLAAATPFDPQQVIAAAARDIQAVRDLMNGYTIKLPVGFNVTYSHENQPPGLCHHISISVDRRNKLPSPEAVEMILEAFEMRPISASLKVWPEIIAGEKAVNVLQLVQPA